MLDQGVKEPVSARGARSGSVLALFLLGSVGQVGTDAFALPSALLSSSMSSFSSFARHSSSPSFLARRTMKPALRLPYMRHSRTCRQAISSSANTAAAQQQKEEQDDYTSTLTLLEHVNVNVPNHDYVMPFFLDILGFGLDPRRAANAVKGSKTLWMNCGSSQFHLPYDEVPQVVPGSIGLRYASLEPLKRRLEEASTAKPKSEWCFDSFQVGTSETSGMAQVRITDRYGNVYFCREGPELTPHIQPQPVVRKSQVEEYGEVAERYGLDEGAQTECRGIDYVELRVPRGTADQLRVFYENVFDATVSTVEKPGANGRTDLVTIVAFGKVDAATGRPAQSLLFCESDEEIPPYDGHHVALYVGKSWEDYQVAFENCDMAKVVWVNTRFSDDTTDLAGARKWMQYRFKDLLDLPTGRQIFELEHEVRCIEHSAWPGFK